MLLRQQEESRLNEDMKRSYREKLKELEDTADYLNHSYNKKKDMDTVEKEQAVREAMRSQIAAPEGQPQKGQHVVSAHVPPPSSASMAS